MISFNTNINNPVAKTPQYSAQKRQTPNFKGQNPVNESSNKHTGRNILFISGLLTTAALCIKNKNLLKLHFNKPTNEIKYFPPKLPKTHNHQFYRLAPPVKNLLTEKIKPYLNSLKDGECVDPAKLDEILTSIVGRNNVKEKIFFPDPLRGITCGRKKTYKYGDRIITLETHTSRHGIVTRVYDNKNAGSWVDKFKRSYLHNNGTFAESSYFSNEAHLQSGQKGLEWINAA